MKKIISCFLSIMLVFLFPINALATNLGELECWYSDENYIGRFDYSSLRIFTKKLNSNADFPFSEAVTHAKNQWGNTLDFTFYTTINKLSANIIMYGGTAEEIDALGIFEDVGSRNGSSKVTDKYFEGTWTFGTTQKNGYCNFSGEAYVVDNNRTLNQYKKTATHEMGHLCGWHGHSSNSNDIMYSRGSSVTSLTSRDIAHLIQVY